MFFYILWGIKLNLNIEFEDKESNYLRIQAKKDDISINRVIINSVRAYQLYREGYLIFNKDKISRKSKEK